MRSISSKNVEIVFFEEKKHIILGPMGPAPIFPLKEIPMRFESPDPPVEYGDLGLDQDTGSGPKLGPGAPEPKAHGPGLP